MTAVLHIVKQDATFHVPFVPLLCIHPVESLLLQRPKPPMWSMPSYTRIVSPIRSSHHPSADSCSPQAQTAFFVFPLAPAQPSCAAPATCRALNYNASGVAVHCRHWMSIVQQAESTRAGSRKRWLSLEDQAASKHLKLLVHVRTAWSGKEVLRADRVRGHGAAITWTLT
jgi:hypothetical protein